MELTPNQLTQLQSLGVTLPPKNKSITKFRKTHSNNFIPLLSLAGLTIIATTSVFIVKNQQNRPSTTQATDNLKPETNNVTPTQVPKSIQHYLLSSQTYFSQALSLTQTNPNDSTGLISHLNNSIISATQAIESYPTDSRGYEQRGKIYVSLIDSRPQYLLFAISDYSSALKLNPSSSKNAHTLASLYARQGDSSSTLHYLGLALTLDPTNPQNFYDLAAIQKQTGLIPQALATYRRLLPLVTDASQKQKIEQDTQTLQNLVSQNPSSDSSPPPPPTPTFTSPLLQAQLLPPVQDGVIIATPETIVKTVLFSDAANSNSLSGTAILTAGSTSISITNNLLSPSSQVYLTITKGGKNQSLQVISKTQNSFTAGLPSPIPEDIEFQYWIVN